MAKRQAEDNEEPEETTEETTEEITEDYTTPIAEETTTTITPDVDEDTETVKPLVKDTGNKKEDKKVKDPKKKPASTDLLNRGGEPSTNLLPPLPFNCLPPSYFGQSPPLPQYPPAFAPPLPQAAAPWTYSFLLPHPSIPEYLHPSVASVGYDYPQPSGPAFSAGGFASASASASANGQGGSVSTSTSPGGSVQSSYGIGNRGSFPDTVGQSGPFPSGGVSQSSSSHSSSGPNGHESSSSISNAGPGGIQTSYSHSGPNGIQQGSYGAPYPSGNAGPNGPFSNVPNSGSFVSTAGTIPSNGQPSFIGIRGSFGGDEDDSIAIEVDGPENTRINPPEGTHISQPIGGSAGKDRRIGFCVQ